MPVSIRVESLQKNYGAHQALVDVTFTVENSVILGLLGPNGAGKSTTLRVLAGLLRPSGGTVKVLDADPWRERALLVGKVGVLLDAAFHPHLTAATNLKVLARLDRVGVGEQRRTLESVGLGEVAHKRVSSFSFGMTQRLGLAQALMGKPRVLILDEPFVGLDPVGVADFKEQIRRMADQNGATVILSSHQLADITDVCDEIAVIHRGRSVLRGTVQELTANTGYLIDPGDCVAAMAALVPLGVGVSVQDDLLFVNTVEGDSFAEVLRRLVEAGLPVRHVEPVRSTLYEVFSEQVGERVNG